MKNKIKISVIKHKALQLKVNYQIPYVLYQLIMSIDSTCSESYIHKLTRLSEFYIRIKGYYNRYPLIEKEYNDLLKQEFKMG